MRRATIVAVAALMLAACAEEPPEQFRLVVTASSDEGPTLAGATVHVEDKVVGPTDARGRLITSVPGPRGRRVRVSVDAPTGYRAVVSGRLLTLERLRAVRGASDGGADADAAALEFNARFAPRTRRAVILVDVGRPGLDVEVFGARRAVTNEAGVAMLLTTGAPGDHVVVRVPASGRTDLRPRFLARTFTFPDKPDAFVLDGAFTEIHKPVKRPPRPTRL